MKKKDIKKIYAELREFNKTKCCEMDTSVLSKYSETQYQLNKLLRVTLDGLSIK